jgi:hypothetical protein
MSYYIIMIMMIVNDYDNIYDHIYVIIMTIAF